jgi:alpha,alpha-trehalase
MTLMTIRALRTPRALGALVLVALLAAVGAAAPRGGPVATAADLAAIRGYIKRGWTELRRSHRALLAAATDPKLPGSSRRWPVYVADSVAAVRDQLVAEGISDDELGRIELRRLPADRVTIADHGVLWLPEPYVVPGGRFNEMYGWDSYFIVLGLVRDGELALARGMVDNAIYEIEHYGTVLNANRTYYLTRSQPPLLTEMVLAVYARTRDRAWLAGAVPAIEAYYRYWTTGPHLTATGLSRYFDAGTGPAPEVLAGQRDSAGRTHYDRVKAYYRTHAISDYDVSRFYDAGADRLTEQFFIGDRSMRESGFDPSNRFGPFNAAVIDLVPVCLNSLLYQMERDTAAIAAILGQRDRVRTWEARAEVRKARIQAVLWDEPTGLYLDYDTTTQQRRRYPFLTTFWPLWVGIADPAQAHKVVGNLGLFERPGGLQTSAFESGSQWDAPYGWAPLELIAIRALRRYGYARDADRITVRFLSLILQVFVDRGTIVEKYDVVARTASTHAAFGYPSNEVGFGWTNAVFLELLADLPAARRPDIARAANGSCGSVAGAGRCAAAGCAPQRSR